MIPLEQVLIAVAVLLLVAVLASKASDRLGIPSVLLFLLVGMLAGSEGPGGIPFDDARLAQSVGIIALVFILFAGGLDTRWEEVSRVFWKGLSLATLGVALTALLVGAFAAYLLGISWLEGLLLGSIVSSTDAAAVFAILRSRGASLKGRTKPLLELESGSNDPMAVFLTLAVIRLLTRPEEPVLDLASMFILQMALGGILGYALGKAAIALLNHLKLETEGLYPVLTLAWALLTYGATTVVGGNGFLAVYLAGIVMGNGDFIHKRSLLRFQDALAWLMQIAMFLTLGLLVFPSRLVPVIGVGLLISLFLMFVARPASVFLSLAFARMGLRHKLMISWVGLRGAVPIILATFPLVAGVPHADLLFNIVFFIVLTSVLLQGTTLPLVAKWLGLRAPLSARSKYELELFSGKSDSELAEITVSESSPAVGKQVVELQLPRSSLIVLLNRNGTSLVPRGATVLQPGDTLLLLSSKADLAAVRSLFDPASSRQEQ
ncbi:MAG TPA: potassium/proton antiporter [Terriglobia bacterium]|nr:potassium/proton antiporter [Terriglobia bacterium]